LPATRQVRQLFNVRDFLESHIRQSRTAVTDAIAGTLKLISEHQEVQNKLRLALREAYSAANKESRQPTVAEITKIAVPYLDAVVEESLRFESPLPLFSREATQDTHLLGCRLPKGTQVFFAVTGPSFKSQAFAIDSHLRSATSREKSVRGQWSADDVHLFKPERWLKSDGTGNMAFDAQAGPVLAFSLGPRSCFGRRLAYLELRMVLALLVWNFEFEQLDKPFNSHQPYDSITTMPRYCYVALKQCT
jgi:cytochrome P450